MKKTLFLAAAAAAMLASPVLAQTRHVVRHHRQASLQYAPFAQSEAVFEAGEYVGADPDANVRLELRRDTRPYSH